MSLKEEIADYYKTDSTPPEGNEFEPEAELVKTVYKDELRWGILKWWVYKRGDEYVAVQDVEPATEMQDWGDYGDPEIFSVIPQVVTTTVYERFPK